MKRQPYAHYSREFKAEAICLALAGDKPANQFASELGICVNQIGKWKKQLENEALTGASDHAEPIVTAIRRPVGARSSVAVECLTWTVMPD